MVDVSVVEWVTVPGLAFNRQGDRLGYGGGYYDKLLAIMPKAIRVGVAFSTQMSSDIPLEHHDLRMDMLITEKETIAFDRLVTRAR
jgi:5-formyltetrahydrofolate cyclo-ligase